MRYNRLAFPLLAAVGVALAGCTGKPAEENKNADSTMAGAAPQEVKIVKGENGPAFPDAKLTVTIPTADQVIATDSFMVKVDLKGVDLAAPTAGEQSKGIAYSKDGQHIHVIIDDKPYMAMYKQDSFKVGGLSEGVHTLRAFPSRSWHESIKTPGAFVAETFYMKKKTGTPVLTPGAPLLTYSRPKGDYKGADTKSILLDFYLSNAQLGPDKYKVIASIDGQVKDTITEWIPYFIQGLTDGEHKIKLELIGPDGKVVPGQFNSAERTIKVMSQETTAAATPASATPAPADSGMKMSGGADTSSKAGMKMPGAADTSKAGKMSGGTDKAKAGMKMSADTSKAGKKSK